MTKPTTKERMTVESVLKSFLMDSIKMIEKARKDVRKKYPKLYE